MDGLLSKAHRAAFLRLPPQLHGEPDATNLLSDHWDDKLGEPRAHAVQRWLNAGAYRKCDVMETLSLTLTLPPLKAMLKERGLKVGGRKAELFLRLLAADPAAVKRWVDAHPVYLLSDDSLSLFAEIRSEFAHEEAIVFEEVSELLDRGDIEEAVERWRRHDSETVFSAVEGTIGFEDNRQLGDSHREDIRRFFAFGAPEIATRLSLEVLFGRGPATRETRLLYTRGAFERDRARWAATSFVVGIQIHRNPNPGGICDACADVVGCWPKDKAPTIPYERCEHEDGCPCFWTAVFEDEEPPTPWRA